MPKVIYGPIKVLELIHNSNVTGPGRDVLGCAKYAQKQDFCVDVLCPGSGFLPDELSKLKIKIIPLFPWHGIRVLVDFFRLRKILAKEKYHVFNIHSGQLNAFSKIMAWSLGITAVIFTEHMAVADHRWIKNKFILAIHLLCHRVSGILEDKVIAVSQTARSTFIVRQGVNPRKVETVYNGVDLEEIEEVSDERKNGFREKWGISTDAQVISIIGRLSPEKGHKVFILAAKEIIKTSPHAMFMVVGDGSNRKNIEEMINEVGLKRNFVMTGVIKNLDDFLAVTDIAVQPSYEGGESFGLTVAEAMSRGKPVVVSNIRCFREIVSDGKNGLIFDSGDYLSLAAKVRELLGDSALRMSLGEAARKTVKDRFDSRFMASNTERVYKEVLRQKGFMLYNEHIRQVETEFLDDIKKEVSLPPEKIKTLRLDSEKLLTFIYGRKRGPEEIEDYLTKEYMFLIEKFLEFIERRKPFLEPDSRCNLRSFRRQIKAMPVSPKDYDERVKLQSEQFQIDNYYEPKDPALKARVELLLGFLNPRKGERILDLGCGVGTFAFHCAKHGALCCGVDYSQSSLDMASRLVDKFGLKLSIEFKCCDISNGLPYADKSFDKIVSADFIEHIDRKQKLKFISELRRLLKPKGQAVVFTPNLFREQLGGVKAKLTELLGGAALETRLHFGLISRFDFEKMLKNEGFVFKRVFLDVERPFLTRIPVLKEILSLNLLWVIENN